jgi:hypothetical protein
MAKKSKTQSDIPFDTHENDVLFHVPTDQELVLALQEQQGKKVKKEKQEKKTEEKTPLVLMSGSGTEYVPMSSLVPLDSSSIPDARLAMRTVNRTHVENLMTVPQSDLPPIEVQKSNEGLLVIDGYHRWAAIAQKVRQDFEETGESEENIVEALKNHMILVHYNNYTSALDILKAAFSANLAHGLPANTNSRSRYALFLMKVAEANGETLSLRKAAEMAHVSHVAVIHYRDRDKKVEKMSDGFNNEESTETDDATKLIKSSDMIAKHMRKLFALFKDDGPQALCDFMKASFTSDDKEMLKIFATAFKLLEVTNLDQ